MTNVLPASAPPRGVAVPVNCRPACFNDFRIARLCASPKKWMMLAAIFGPMAGVSRRVSSVADCSASMLGNASASARATPAPTCRMPSRKEHAVERLLLAPLDGLQEDSPCSSLPSDRVPPVRSGSFRACTDVSDVPDDPLCHELIHRGFAQSFDVHGAA